MKVIIEINGKQYEILDFIGEPVQVSSMGALEYVYTVKVTEIL